MSFRSLLFVLALFALASCGTDGQVVEAQNSFGGQTIEFPNPPKSRLSLRRVFYDGQKQVRQEERYPVPDAAANLGFDYQKVSYDSKGNLAEDLRVSPNEIDNLHGYASFLRVYAPGSKIERAEVEFKAKKAKAQGYKFSTVYFGPGAKPVKVLYYDNDRKLIPQSAPAKP
ncbi:MAG: hypothetical protein A2600_04615 [Candidatus Lambdaproteobacteria bacterium RIFOXYD1_FULL_56_27]|uniref:Lipoprotein n=1 Tax=Candidatus Lambdaproteobacteria bacterium RIFOXYD2_FULL_56_26 TaxID=1817773 RepID=A0A1F6H3T5_9PROT|nr:MAG: hypothetical protein A2426_13680 [Candidatus Lambdaproteobacteria bacterium RIFOXYC1_FULL_56_13]OGH05037.1 MAG: hypothetical protein A2557_08680 [Candidatus Lambdaproteobacteria bacterium RIFOXYD2_FULL_56_26]OGH09502.1 MAG: hypothetical protein A2600_04615 [Candidatus Lambdaproteobacteria bacterium RIFOXYD1_FULL_56_27]